MSKNRVAFRRILRIIKKAGVAFFTALPLLKFFINIDTISQLKDLPFAPQIISFVSTNYWAIALVVSIALLIVYIISYSITYHDPISTGGYFKIYEQKKTEHFYRLRRCLKQKSKMNESEIFFDEIQMFGSDLCDCIANLMDYNFDNKFSVCIKLLDVRSARVTQSSNEIMLHTFCRGGEDKHERMESDVGPIPLKSNSDFLSIFDGHRNNFCCGNLRMYRFVNNHLSAMFPDKFEECSNSTQHFWEKYVSTIVVPIKLSDSYVTNDYNIRNGNKDQLLGFLCLDCKKRLSKSMLRKMLPYMDGFSNSLYAFFDELNSVRKRFASNSQDRYDNIFYKGDD